MLVFHFFKFYKTYSLCCMVYNITFCTCFYLSYLDCITSVNYHLCIRRPELFISTIHIVHKRFRASHSYWIDTRLFYTFKAFSLFISNMVGVAALVIKFKGRVEYCLLSFSQSSQKLQALRHKDEAASQAFGLVYAGVGPPGQTRKFLCCRNFPISPKHFDIRSCNPSQKSQKISDIVGICRC